jgi:L-threonylcarbamoyladenylate synthase
VTVLPFHDPADARAALAAVADHLAAGSVLAYPTETVYGFGTALQPTGLARLATLKGRPEEKPFLVLAADPLALPGLRWTRAARLLAANFWPGPLSLAVAADERYPPGVRSAAGQVAVRDTPLPALRALLQGLGRPITSTSANLPGQPPATTLVGLRAVLDALPAGRDVLVLDGGSLPASPPSTVVDCAGERPRIVRAGALRRSELQAVLEPEGVAIDE